MIGELTMKKLLIATYLSFPFFTCSLFAVLVQYTTSGGGMFDFSILVVWVTFVFWGTIMSVINILISKVLERKQILNSIWMYQIAYFIAYVLICIVSGLFIRPMYSYKMVSFTPFILIVVSVFLNIIINIIKKPINEKCIFDKAPIIVGIVLLCFSIVSITYFYVQWDSSKEWAKMREGDIIWTRTRKEEKNIVRYYDINAVTKSDEVYSMKMEEIYYYNTEEERIKIVQYLKEKKVGKITETQFIKEGYKKSYCIEYSLGDWFEPTLTEESLRKFNPLLKDITVNNKINYSKLLNLLLDNGFSYS
jgi:hypothetical protein